METKPNAKFHFSGFICFFKFKKRFTINVGSQRGFFFDLNSLKSKLGPTSRVYCCRTLRAHVSHIAVVALRGRRLEVGVYYSLLDNKSPHLTSSLLSPHHHINSI